MAKRPDRVPEDELALYRKLIDSLPGIELKGGLKLPHTSTGGHMFSSLTKDGRLGIRLSKEDAAAFIAKYGAVPFRNYGANIREHVEVPGSLLRKTKELARWLRKSHSYTKMLKPK